MRVSTSKPTYVVFHMSLLQVAWGLTLVAQVCQKAFDYIIIVHIHVLLHAFATKLPGGTLFGAQSSGPEVRGPTLVAQVCRKTFDYIIRVHIHVLLHAFATKLPGGHPVRGPKFGARLLWHRYAKKHLITSSEFTYMCFYMPLLQSCLGGTLFGARSSGPDSCCIGMPKSI